MNIPKKFKKYHKPDGTTAWRPIKEQAYMTLAVEMALLATCDRLQVGAVFTDARMERVLCSGYNGNICGGPNGCDSHVPGNCGCLHAEQSSLTKSQSDMDGAICFVTTGPCIMCSKVLINRRISKVIYLKDYRLNEGVELLRKYGVEVIKYSDLPGESHTT